MEAIVSLVAVFAMLFTWAAVGHGIWLLLGLIFRGLTGQRCPKCHQWLNGSHACRCTISDSHLNSRLSSRSQPLSSSQELPLGTPAETPLSQDLVALQRLIDHAKAHRSLDFLELSQLRHCLEKLTHAATAETAPKTLTPPATASFATPPRVHAEPLLDKAADQAELITARIVEPLFDFASTTKATVAPVHPLDMPDEDVKLKPSRPDASRRIAASLLRSFMERSNIRWIELISATLVVVCSVGLVISLWSTLSRTSRFFPSLVFMLATMAVHAAGQYTLRRWKLRTTSRGILHIGLMLIPLAIMVGILLSRRGDLPTWNWQMAVAIGVALTVYGGLAVSAAKSLFNTQWLGIAVSTLVASITLIAAAYGVTQTNTAQRLHAWLIPTCIVSAILALQLSFSAAHRQQGTSQFVRRQLGMAIQAIFATVTASVFWYSQYHGTPGFSNWWWSCIGIVAVCWSGWGWTLSLAASPAKHDRATTPIPLASSEMRSSNRLVDVSWMMVTAWVISLPATLVLLACFWQLASHRYALMGLLLAASVWWFLLGSLSRLTFSLVASGLALSLAVALGGESFQFGNQTPEFTDWLSLTRIAWLSGGSLVLLAVSFLATGWRQTKQLVELTPQIPQWTWPSLRNLRARCATPHFVGSALRLSGAAGAVLGALLTVIASLVPWGPTPYGGDWAPALLAFYGVMLTGLALVAYSERSWLISIGQAFTVVAVIELCERGSWISTWLMELRPYHASAVGLSWLAAAWSVLAAGLRWRATRNAPQSSNVYQPSHLIAWLTTSAVCVSLLTIPWIWRTSDHFECASLTGWTLPLVSGAWWYARSSPTARELGLLCLAAWCCAALTNWGVSEDWWSTLGTVGSVSVYVAVICTLVLAAAEGLSWLRRGQLGGQLLDAPYWSIAGLLFVSLSVLICTLAFFGSEQLAASLGLSVSPRNSVLPTAQTQLVWMSIATAIISLSLALLLAAQLPKLEQLRDWLSCIPCISALAMAVCIPTPYSLPACLWTLAGFILLSESFRAFGSRWAQVSEAAWMPSGSTASAPRHMVRPLAVVRWLAGFALLGLSMTAIIQGSLEILPSPLLPAASDVTWMQTPFSSRCLKILIWVGPLLSVVGTRWLLGVVFDSASQLNLAAGIMSMLACACLVTLAIGAPASQPLFGCVRYLQSVVLVGTVLVLVSLAIPLARNFFLLRRLSPASSTWQLCQQSTKGGRWKRAITSAWQLNTFNLSSLGLMCAFATLGVVWLPIFKMPVVSAMADKLTVEAYLGAIGSMFLLGLLRRAKLLGLLAMALGLLAPLITVFYADALGPVSNVGGAQPSGFEPLRLQTCLWLAALALGLGLNTFAHVRSRMAEGLWIGLAMLVSSLGFISFAMDPRPFWPAIEMTVLAVLMLLSSLVQQQMWRGHLAAIAASVGVLGFMRFYGQPLTLESLWIALWGPAWCAWLSAIGMLLLQRLWAARQNAADNASFAQSFTLGWQLSVDQTVSLHGPVTIIGLTLYQVLGSQSLVLLNLLFGLAIFLFALAILRLWDMRSYRRGWAIYVSTLSWSLTSAVAFNQLLELPALESRLMWLAAGLGALALLAAGLRESLRELPRLIPALRLRALVPRATELERMRGTMVALHSLFGVCLLVPCSLLVLSFERQDLRLATAALPFLSALSILPIAMEITQRVPRVVVLWLISIAAVMIGWADLPGVLGNPQRHLAEAIYGTWMTQDAIFWSYLHHGFVALVFLSWGYWLAATFFPKWLDWPVLLTSGSWIALGLAFVLGGLNLLSCWLADWDTLTQTAPWQFKATFILAWLLIAGRFFQVALIPSAIEQTVASLEMRQAAVYATEVGLGLSIAATYYAYPDLFSGLVAAWWPVIVFVLAMFSAGLGQWCHQTGRVVLADPVTRSSLLLPVLPLVGVWWPNAMEPTIDWSDWQRYSFLLLSASLLYGLHNWFRPSLGLRILSTGLTLLSFWSLLHSQPNLRFLEHPQLWLLPPALATLVFVERNRERMQANVVVATRYLAILVAYLSSTADMLLKAFEGQMWQPVILLMLAIAGVIAGIALRVRAFLYCGMAFVGVALIGMVWHAQQALDQVWPWWAFGILTGICLIVLLGYFEKNKSRVLAYLEQLKAWQL